MRKSPDNGGRVEEISMGEFSKIIEANWGSINHNPNLKVSLATGTASFEKTVDGEKVIYITNNKGRRVDEEVYFGKLSWHTWWIN